MERQEALLLASKYTHTHTQSKPLSLFQISFTLFQVKGDFDLGGNFEVSNCLLCESAGLVWGLNFPESLEPRTQDL